MVHFSQQIYVNKHFLAWVLKSKILPNKFDMLFEEITKWVDEGSPVDIICLDFQKAFYKVPHQRIIQSYGIGIIIINVIEQWLSDRI